MLKSSSGIEAGSSLNRESMYGRLAKRLVRIESGGRKLRLVGRVGIVLRFQAETAVGRVSSSQVVTGIELDAGLSCQHFHDATTEWIPSNTARTWGFSRLSVY